MADSIIRKVKRLPNFPELDEFDIEKIQSWVDDELSEYQDNTSEKMILRAGEAVLNIIGQELDIEELILSYDLDRGDIERNYDDFGYDDEQDDFGKIW